MAKNVKKFLPTRMGPTNNVTLEEFLTAANNFTPRPPLSTNLTSTLLHSADGDPETISNNINQSYPLIHQDVIPLIADFLQEKLDSGSAVEKKLYQKMSVIDFLDRLLKKRPLKFIMYDDKYLLRNGTKGRGGFESIGGANEKYPLTLENYLSYDEMKISALLGVSSPTYVINNGARKNCGVCAEDGTYEKTAVVVGLIGCRLKKHGFMESQDCHVFEEQNTPANGCGSGQVPDNHKAKLSRLWAKFYGLEAYPTFSDAARNKKAYPVTGNKKILLNEAVYKRRISLAAEMMLTEANERGKAAGKQAYIHVVGLGLGVWRQWKGQDARYADAFGETLKKLGPNLDHISDVDFSWIPVETFDGIKDGDTIPGCNIRVHISYRDPYAKLASDRLVVAMYAWDGNAFPGNEYWGGSLSGSGDSAAAACTQIAELQNAYINPKICGENFQVVVPHEGIVPMGQFIARLK